MAKKRKKLKPIGKLVDECAKLLQKLRRMELADDGGWCECWSCGTRKHFTEMQGGHFIPRGKAATKLVEENIHPQCPPCNLYGMRHGDAEKQYTLRMLDWYGREFVDGLIERSKQTHKWNRVELEDMKKELQSRILDQEARLNLS